MYAIWDTNYHGDEVILMRKGALDESGLFPLLMCPNSDQATFETDLKKRTFGPTCDALRCFFGGLRKDALIGNAYDNSNTSVPSVFCVEADASTQLNPSINWNYESDQTDKWSPDDESVIPLGCLHKASSRQTPMMALPGDVRPLPPAAGGVWECVMTAVMALDSGGISSV